MKDTRSFSLWFLVVSVILIIAGSIFSLFGFTFFPPNILPRSSLLPWVSGIYGSVLIGWGLSLLLIGRIAFLDRNAKLLRALSLGIFAWLAIEAIVSAATAVYFNIGVDIAVGLLLIAPLELMRRKIHRAEGRRDT